MMHFEKHILDHQRSSWAACDLDSLHPSAPFSQAISKTTNDAKTRLWISPASHVSAVIDIPLLSVFLISAI